MSMFRHSCIHSIISEIATSMNVVLGLLIACLAHVLLSFCFLFLFAVVVFIVSVVFVVSVIATVHQLQPKTQYLLRLSNICNRQMFICVSLHTHKYVYMHNHSVKHMFVHMYVYMYLSIAFRPFVFHLLAKSHTSEVNSNIVRNLKCTHHSCICVCVCYL